MTLDKHVPELPPPKKHPVRRPPIGCRRKTVRNGFYHDMAVMSAIKVRNGGLCR